uniref:Uncharacterized protein n=1 Tax=Trichuris muris TaxID=70415 RepID=A0A5S6QF15_TRIMR
MDPNESISPFLRLMNELQSNSGQKPPANNGRAERSVGNNSLVGGSKFAAYSQRKETLKPMHERNEASNAGSADQFKTIQTDDSVACHVNPLKCAANQSNTVHVRAHAQCDKVRSADNCKAGARQLTLNATIRNVKEWSEYQGLYLSLLFDVYSVLDSDIICNRFGGSQFTLRDQTGCLLATYYSIDEEIIPAKMGDWLRVEGVVRSWGFQATSVKYAEANFLKGLREKIIASKIALENRLYQLYG